VFNFRWTISTRTVTIAWVAVVITAVAGLLIQRSVIREQGLVLARQAMRGVILSAESTRESVGEMNVGGTLDQRSLLSELRTSPDFRKTRIYRTIPVVAAWQAIEHVAAKEGYEFRIPSHDPRNPKNTPTPDEEKILATFNDSSVEDYFSVDPKKNEMVYARPIRLSEQCMMCHGNPGPNQKDGKDIVGFRMEGWHAGEIHGAFLLDEYARGRRPGPGGDGKSGSMADSGCRGAGLLRVSGYPLHPGAPRAGGAGFAEDRQGRSHR
jgi:methyl-accepting chemotaxis protein